MSNAASLVDAQSTHSPAASARSRYTHWVNVALLIAAYFVVAAASFNGFYDKWNFADESKRFPLVRTLEGTSERPVVYRQLLPDIANRIDSSLSANMKSKIAAVLHSSDGMLRTKIRSAVADDPRYILRYHLIYYMAFAFLFSSLFVLRQVALMLPMNPVAATLAPLAFALLLPIFQTGGGYYYDFSELFFMAAAAWLCLTGKPWGLLPLAILATWNKESFLAFLPALYPLIRAKASRPQAAVTVVASMTFALATYAYVRLRFQHNPGPPVEFHLIENLLYYLNPIDLVRLEVNYGIVMAKGSALLVMALIAVIAQRGWRELPDFAKHHVLVAGAINLPLFFLFDGPGEVRALSMLYLGLVWMLGVSLSHWAASHRSNPGF